MNGDFVQERKLQLEATLASLTATSSNLADALLDPNGDEIDRTVCRNLADLEVMGLAVRHATSTMIRNALWTIQHDQAHYGICLDCDEEISLKRLMAIPWAAYCVSCAARREEMAKSQTLRNDGDRPKALISEE